MEVLIAVITVIWSILGIILFFKIWGMTNNVKDIHDWLMESKLKEQKSNEEISPSFTPHSKIDLAELSEAAVPTPSFNGNLKKGDKVSIVEYGTCTFEGIYQGKYVFYPENNIDLPNSPFLVNDVEPYLLIPKNKLDSIIV